MKREKSIVKIKVVNEISDANEIRTRERGERGKEYLEDFSVVKCFQVFTSTMSSSSSSTSSPPARVVLEVHHLERDVLYHVRELGATSLFQQSIALYVGALIFAALLGLFVYFCIWANAKQDEGKVIAVRKEVDTRPAESGPTCPTISHTNLKAFHSLVADRQDITGGDSSSSFGDACAVPGESKSTVRSSQLNLKPSLAGAKLTRNAHTKFSATTLKPTKTTATNNNIKNIKH